MIPGLVRYTVAARDAEAFQLALPIGGSCVNPQLVARGAVSVVCVLQGATQTAIDIGRTHAKNPLWARHARFHVVWQSGTVVLLCAAALTLLWLAPAWLPGLPPDLAFYLALLLAGCSPLSFLVALVTRRLFDSALSDPNGMRPIPVRVGSKTIRVEMNAVTIWLGLVTLLASAALYAS